MPSSRRTRRSVLVGLGSVALTTLAGCRGPLERATTARDLPALDGSTALAAAGVDGDVTVTGATRETGHLTLTKRTRRGVDLDQVSVSVTRRGGVLHLVPDIPDDVPRGAVGIEMAVDVPRGTPVAAVETVNGDVGLEDVGGDPTVTTTNGDVGLTTIAGAVAVETGNGDVDLADVEGVSTLRTTNGAITATVTRLPGDATVETTNGDVTLTLAPALDARLEVRVATGDVTTRGLPFDRPVSEATHLSGVLGDGGHTLRVQTVTGDVRLERGSP